jgi:hypothetical protein
MRLNPSSMLTLKPYAERQTCQAKPPPGWGRTSPPSRHRTETPGRSPHGANVSHLPGILGQLPSGGLGMRGPGESECPIRGVGTDGCSIVRSPKNRKPPRSHTDIGGPHPELPVDLNGGDVSSAYEDGVGDTTSGVKKGFARRTTHSEMKGGGLLELVSQVERVAATSSPKPLPAAIHHLKVIEANTVVARPGWPITDNDPKSVVFVHVQRDKGAIPMWSWRRPRSGRLNDRTHCVEAGPPLPGHKPSFEVDSHAATAGDRRELGPKRLIRMTPTQ